MENRTLTILFADMRGFSNRASYSSRRDTVDLIKHLHELLLPVMTQRGGQLIKTMGDGFLLTFESPTDAVLAALEVQYNLRRHNAGVTEADRIELRIGINTGEVTLEAGDVYGEAVNIAARVQAIAEPNETYVTQATVLAMNTAEVQVERVGRRSLKGIARPIEVYHIVSVRGQHGPGHTWLKAVGVSLAVCGLLGFWWVRRSGHPGQETTAVALPAPRVTPATIAPDPTMEAEALPPVEVAETFPSPPEPDPEQARLVREALDGFSQTLSGLSATSHEVERMLREGASELGRVKVDFNRLKDSINFCLRDVPYVRKRHTDRVKGLIDQVNQQQNREAADTLWRDLGQFEANLEHWNGQLSGWVGGIDGSLQAVEQWEATVVAWEAELLSIQQELDQQSVGLAAGYALTAWDTALDQVGPALDSLAQRLVALEQALPSLQADVDWRKQEIDGYEQARRGWEDFQDQWRDYLRAWE